MQCMAGLHVQCMKPIKLSPANMPSLHSHWYIGACVQLAFDPVEGSAGSDKHRHTGRQTSSLSMALRQAAPQICVMLQERHLDRRVNHSNVTFSMRWCTAGARELCGGASCCSKWHSGNAAFTMMMTAFTTMKRRKKNKRKKKQEKKRKKRKKGKGRASTGGELDKEEEESRRWTDLYMTERS